MSEFEQQPDEFWRKAFEESAETPPPRVWDAIERRLDESEDPRVLPLWGMGLGASRPVLWGAGLAAAVALLLVGWWAMQNQTARNAETPVAQTSRAQPNRTAPNAPSVEAPATLSTRAGRAADVASTPDADSPTLARHATRPSQPRRASVKPPTAPTRMLRLPSTPSESLAQSDAHHPNVTAEHLTKRLTESTAPTLAGNPSGQKPVDVNTFAPAANQSVAQPVGVTPSATHSAGNVTFTPAPPTTVSDQATAPTSAVAGQSASQPAALREPAPSALANDVFATEPTATQSKQKSREVWASVSLMPGAFDPAVAVRTAAAPTLVNTSALNYARTSNVPTVNSRANFSVAYLASAGVQLNERWSVESGVGYLAGRSTVDSPTQVSSYASQFVNANGALTANSGVVNQNETGNLYIDALRSQLSTTVANQAMPSADALLSVNKYQVFANYSEQARQSLSNDYQYVQVPVQVGYQLRPRKRLGLALLGGFLTNIFVRNTVADELVITSRDGVYRPLSWAASLGARFRYRPSRRWSASLAGLYQPSLGLGTRPASVVQSQPTSLGMSFGVDYHF